MATPERLPTERPRRIPLLATMLAVVTGFVLLVARPQRPRSISGRGQPGVAANPRAVSLGYETEDISAGLVARILAGLAITTVVSIAVLFLMIHWFRGADSADRPALTTEQSVDIVPPGPNLQRDPYRELRDQQAAEAKKLAGYAWADPAHTRARIPIARAMALVTGRSLDPQGTSPDPQGTLR